MDLVGCPPWIEPGNAFGVVLKVAKYTVDVEYGGLVEMAEQEHELWLDRSIGYSLAQFYDDVATKIIWGPNQTLSIWVLDTDTGSEWKIRRDDQWQVMMKDKWDERVTHIAVEVVAKDGYERNDNSVASKVSDTGISTRSGVTNLDVPSAGPNAEVTRDTCTSSPQHVDETVPCLLSHPAPMESMKKKAKRVPPSPPSPTVDGAGGADRISALDDDLRELILRLAHLNMKELVRTSVLSKRWRGLWKRVPVLDFFGWPELESAGAVQQYIAIVNDVLGQRAGVTSEARIDEVKIPLLLDVYSPCCRQQLLQPAVEAVEAWIRYAMHHQVKGLQLNLRLPPLVNMEHSKLKKPVMDLDELLPSSPKLECMRLGLSYTKVRLPRTAVFTSLKDLTLEFVELAAGSGHLLARLSAAACCPSLQKLRMMHINFVDHAWTKELVLDAGELLELSVQGVSEMELLELRTPKLLYLEINECEHLELVRVSAPGLKELTNFRNTAFIHGPLPRLWRLKIDLFAHMEEDDNEEDPNSSNICLLKRCSSSLRCLLVHLYVPSSENDWRVDLIEDKVPQLPNVTSLWVSIDVECQRHSFGDSVASLLRRFKNLQYLSLQLDDSPDICLKTDEYYSEDADYVDSSLTCNNHSDHWKSSDISLANLRKAEFRGMTGTGCELRFLRFVLTNATDLQSVTVTFNSYFIEEEEDSRMCYFVHMLLGDGTWTVCENKDEDFDKDYECSRLYKWAPSP